MQKKDIWEDIIGTILSTGETVIFRYTSDNNWHRPCQVFIKWEDGDPILSFTPFAIFADGHEIQPVNEHHILTWFKPDPEVKNGYLNFLDAYDGQVMKMGLQ